MKVTLSEKKKNLQGTNSGRDEAKNQINDLEHKEEKNIHQNSKKKKRIQKMRIGLRTLWYIFKHINNSNHKGARRRGGRGRN